MRLDCLNVHWFSSLAEVQAVVETWRVDYNEIRPHMTLKAETSKDFARRPVAEELGKGR
ncbi:integrase core domain-containing protein [Pseudoduganella sp. R-43]|uniref:integrase core domain-containing protein n=1 Tax=unclassified Pseudoduganella TaxID=2637179 RepID=UPI003CE973BA